MRKNISIAIDGPVGSGKGTLAIDLSKKLNAFYVYTGAMYRELALACLRKSVNTASEEEVLKVLKNISIELKNTDLGVRAFLDKEDVSEEIFQPKISMLTPIVAAFSKIRKEMVVKQQKAAKEAMKRGQNIVMEGRDITTDVLCDADVKIYLTASVEVRAKRRLKQFAEKNIDISFEDVLKDVAERDRKDTQRTVSPLKIASDAIVVDTTNDTVGETVEKVVQILKEKKLI